MSSSEISIYSSQWKHESALRQRKRAMSSVSPPSLHQQREDEEEVKEESEPEEAKVKEDNESKEDKVKGDNQSEEDMKENKLEENEEKKEDSK